MGERDGCGEREATAGGRGGGVCVGYSCGDSASGKSLSVRGEVGGRRLQGAPPTVHLFDLALHPFDRPPASTGGAPMVFRAPFTVRGGLCAAIQTVTHPNDYTELFQLVKMKISHSQVRNCNFLKKSNNTLSKY